VSVAPSSPSRTRSPESQVVGEALVDDAGAATPTRGVVEGVTTSPPMADMRAGSSMHATEGVETLAGGGGGWGDDLPNSRRCRPYQGCA
jgi:hypothetical protein